MQSWKKISTKIILNHPRIIVAEDTVELPNGKVTDYIRFEGNGRAVGIIAKNSEGKILWNKEYSYVPNVILWQIPGGMAKVGESLEEAANRELMEEGKMRAKKFELLGTFYLNHRRSSVLGYVFLATELEQAELKNDDEEAIESVWLNEGEIEEKMMNNEIQDQAALADWALYKSKKFGRGQLRI